MDRTKRLPGQVLKIIVAISFLLAFAMPAECEDAPRKKVVLVFGVYTQWYEFDKVLASCEVRICNAHSKGVENFPDAHDLGASRLLILSDVSGSEFSNAQVKQMKEHIKQGGNLLVMGGPFTLGLGDFDDKGITEMLPVELEVFDLKWEKSGQPLEKAVKHPVFKDMDFAARPMVYWIHQVKPTKEAVVLMKAGDRPCLVVGTYGKGKVAVFTGTPMGLPGEKQLPFWEWDGWTILMSNLAQWLMMTEETKQ